ncbi:MAG: type ISP restriction/modification enzyme [Thermoanaerobaculia bacterium]
MKLETRLKHYFRALHETARRGDAREESFYPALQGFLSDWAHEQGHEGIHVTVNPRPTEGGNPDFRVWDGGQRVIGYVEAKLPGIDLRSITDSEQLERYCKTFPNLILTDFCQFWLFRDGEVKDKVRAGRAMVLTDLDAPPPPENVGDLQDLLTTFLGFSLPRSFDAPTLARELARRTRFLGRIVLAQLQAEQKAKKGRLRSFFQAFRKFLLAQLTEEEFADLYAQTITYGLFAARTRADGDFNRKNAVLYIPRTIGVLHDVFEFLSWGELSEDLAWIVDDIAHVLAVADAAQILDRYYKQGKGADPIVHFYETFLAEYDPEERERRGVYYTPEPVVGYIVRSLHKLLQSEFGLADGLAAKDVTLLDPAAGTMTFVARAVEQAVATFVDRYGEGGRESFLRDRILPNFYGFELMMAPYAVGHLKMGFYLDELGHRLQPDERFQLYLTNTLEMEKKEQSELPGMAALAEEAEHAHEVKQKIPILVILGNPPYSGISSNTGEWISKLIEDYKYVAGEHIREKKHWLQDDYVKFLRFAEWKIAQAGHGVVGMITNHAWLDNPTFRGMRWHLMETFDEIRVLDLHGSTKRQETAPDGGPDKNVFDIQQGVAISFFVKRRTPVPSDARPASVLHAELWGTREDKYAWLDAHDIKDTGWTELQPNRDFQLFVPRDESGLERYHTYPQVVALFPVRVAGIITARDHFVIDLDRKALERRIVQFRDLNLSTEILRDTYGLKDTRGWKIDQERQWLSTQDDWRQSFKRILYRPFDIRWIYYSPHMVDWGREDIMRHMLVEENLALLTCRQISSLPWDHAFVGGTISDDSLVSNRTKERGYLFPLYLYAQADQDEGKPQIGWARAREPNLHPRLLPTLNDSWGNRVEAEALLHYVYAILCTPTYRSTYADLLRIDFPRIPFPAERSPFEAMAAFGKRLVALHLLESPELDPPGVRFEGEGDNRVARKKSDGFAYDPDTERVGINATQYFAPIPRALWGYRIGGYQVLDKWLKDRKERRLSIDDIQTYCRIATALAKTIEIQTELDEIYPAVEETLLDVRLSG